MNAYIYIIYTYMYIHIYKYMYITYTLYVVYVCFYLTKLCFEGFLLLSVMHRVQLVAPLGSPGFLLS